MQARAVVHIECDPTGSMTITTNQPVLVELGMLELAKAQVERTALGPSMVVPPSPSAEVGGPAPTATGARILARSVAPVTP